MRLYVVSLAGKVRAAQVDISTGEATNLPIAMEFTVLVPYPRMGRLYWCFKGRIEPFGPPAPRGARFAACRISR